MPKIVFKKDFDYHPSAAFGVVYAYKAGVKPQTVNQECADMAIKAGYGELAKGKAKP